MRWSLASWVCGEAFVSRGLTRTIIGLVGDIEKFQQLNLTALPGVGDVCASPIRTSWSAGRTIRIAQRSGSATSPSDRTRSH